jgi:DNA-directed RNA polymerase subunit RPC12/RpoP
MIDSNSDEVIKNILANLTEEQKQSLVNQVADLQPDVPLGVKNEEKSNTVNEDFTVNRTSAKEGRQPVRAKKNKWTDKGEARDIETPTFEKTPRVRREHKMEEVECHACGKPFKVDPKHTYGVYHRCNRCGGK